VLNKPADLAVQGGSGIKQSLANYLPALMKPGAETVPMLVHRLDQHASGILVLARTKDAARKLSKSWEQHDIRKLYWAVTIGVPKKLAGNLKTKMVRVSDASGVKVSLLKEEKPERKTKGKKSSRRQVEADELSPSFSSSKLSPEEVKVGISNYHTLAHSGDLISLMALRPRTGRTHQLRGSSMWLSFAFPVHPITFF
jgi:23S rRNA pseudouridine955/2504/2580 synthase